MSGSGWLWLVGAVLLAFAVPFTLIVIKPTNDRLKDPDLGPSSDEARDLLRRRARLHGVRSIAGLMSFLVCLVAIIVGYRA